MTPANIYEFVEFPKMARLSRECVITEKIDGTNAHVFIMESTDAPSSYLGPIQEKMVAVGMRADGMNLMMFAGSRTRFITPKDDNFGFAGWAQRHADAMLAEREK